MTLTHIAVFGFAALIYNWLTPQRWRGWLLMIGSLIAIYWLQPALPVRQLDFVLPTATLLITVTCWLFVRPAGAITTEDRIALGITAGVVLCITGTRYLIPELRLTSRPPGVPDVLLALIIFATIVLLLWRILHGRQSSLIMLIVALILIFVGTKQTYLATELSRVFRHWQGQDIRLASHIDIGWLGFSYVAFRLIHTLRDRQTGQLPPLTLKAYLTYIIFFPSYTAGPIDRAERFVPDYGTLPTLTAARLLDGAGRIVTGLFKKFVIADSLALIALDATNASQATSAGGLWLLLHMYAFRLFFDFSGYSDIAIGIGILYGVRLPENFNRPYLKNNINAFWQSWHMTLSNWVRFYVFSPLSRWLLGRANRPPMIAILLVCHLSTMIIIGLWHGITWAFFIWGLWHGLGLFIHKMWSDRTRKWYIQLRKHPRRLRLWHIAGTILTFYFVLLGWVWFALPDLSSALQVMGRLFGL